MLSSLVALVLAVPALAMPAGGPVCSCPSSKQRGFDPKTYVCHDDRLGPIELPAEAPLSTIIAGYHRFGHMSGAEFLERWWKPSTASVGDGSWDWPSWSGFDTDKKGQPINSTIVLPAGTLLDRFGGTNGQFLALGGTPYSQRGLPPDSLSVNQWSTKEYPFNYHVYNVTSELDVEAGPIKPAFNQPGRGTQFYLKGNTVGSLLAKGLLVEVSPKALLEEWGCFDAKPETKGVETELK